MTREVGPYLIFCRIALITLCLCSYGIKGSYSFTTTTIISTTISMKEKQITKYNDNMSLSQSLSAHEKSDNIVVNHSDNYDDHDDISIGNRKINLNNNKNNKRRSFLFAVATAAATVSTTMSANAEQEKEYRQGIEVNAMNGLIFNYRGSDFNGLDASTISEPTISYADFITKLKDGEVEFVEFMAPNGDTAYATLKSSTVEKEPQQPTSEEESTTMTTTTVLLSNNKNKRIRIGEGYPIEKNDGYSSPLFVVKTVTKYGVPYKFTLPGLSK